MRYGLTALEKLLHHLQLHNKKADGAKSTHSSNSQPTELAIADTVLALSLNPQVNKIDLNFYRFSLYRLGKRLIELLKPLLESSTTISEFDLSYNNLSDEGIEILCESILINQHSAIKILRLKGNDIGDRGAAALAKLLKNNAQLEELELYDNQITALGFGQLVFALQFNHSLKKLELVKNKISDQHAEEVKESIRLGLQNNKFLKELRLSYNAISDRFINFLSDGLKQNSALQVLSLFDNKITADGIKTLANALTNNNALQDLKLGMNTIGDKGAEALGNMLKKNHSLLKLDLSDDKIMDIGAGHLSEGLKCNNALWEMGLNFNNITNTGATMLADALEGNQKSGLTIMNLKKNLIKEEGCNRLTALMQTRLKLTIDLTHNEVDKYSSQYRFFNKIRERNKSIIIEDNPYKRRKIIEEATSQHSVPSLFELSIFAVKEHISKNEYNKLNLPEHIYRHFLRSYY